MTPPTRPTPPTAPAAPRSPGPQRGTVSADAVAGLAREVDGLRRAVDPLRDIGSRVDDLARLVAQLADALAAVSTRAGAAAAPSWLMLPVDPQLARQVLDELCAWLAAVYLRYSDGAAGLPECWCWHPDVVEELLWLMHAWLAAYQGRTASVAAVGDWHDRSRPGVVRRIRAVAGMCSRENHQVRDGWNPPTSTAPQVPAVDEVGSIAAWWGDHRNQPAPEPAAFPATNGAGR